MSLIFHRFKTGDDAQHFVERVEATFPGLNPTIWASQDESDAVDVFPWRLDPPIVLVDRYDESPELLYELVDESGIELLAEEFNGKCAGT